MCECENIDLNIFIVRGTYLRTIKMIHYFYNVPILREVTAIVVTVI